MEPIWRRTAKVLLVDGAGCVLLLQGIDRHRPDKAPIWFPVGGALDAKETVEMAAVREIYEETGLAIDDPGRPVLTHVDHQGGTRDRSEAVRDSRHRSSLGLNPDGSQDSTGLKMVDLNSRIVPDAKGAVELLDAEAGRPPGQSTTA